ncbi:MAG: hypothetical protein EZS28_000706 [Streblomastix strix]|uniref:Uncharacterized protein n=1 Tax=Streblomastix strix TaxID=222440 RepID=A0A5J4X930_9EUKA|nr:MAG: hypothetical protein EZS28_000706 [Streblomastix strix]
MIYYSHCTCNGIMGLTHILNFEETSVQLNGNWNGLVINPIDFNPRFRLVTQRIHNVTLVFCIAADGYQISSGNELGWNCMEIFEKYVKEVLIPEIKARRLAIGNLKTRELLLLVNSLEVEVNRRSEDIATFKDSYQFRFELSSEITVVLQRKMVNKALRDSADRTLLPSNIRSSFLKAGSPNWYRKVIWLKYLIQPISPLGMKVNPRQYTSFDYFGKILTDIIYYLMSRMQILI